jgi:outer membrane protein assembly factor BamE (lipoprotein component of BamABCDE complex)
MQTNQLKASVERIWDAVVGEENRLQRLLNHALVGKLSGLISRTACGEQHHRVRPLTPQTLTTNRPRLNLAFPRWAQLGRLSTEHRSGDPMFAPQGMLIRHFLVPLVTLSGIASCAPSVDQRGNLPNPDKLSEIHAGTTTKDEVAKILGTPSSVSVFNNDKSWYYISRRTSQTAFFDPSVLDQQVYIVKFDDQGIVKAIDHKVLEDGKEITPVARATPAPGRELSFLEQLIGNLGRFNGSSEGSSSGGGGGSPRGPNPTDNGNH